MVHWYKRDPHAAIEGMLGLTAEERGMYNTLIDMLYARDGNVPNDDRFMGLAQQCRPQQWRRVRDALIAKGKVRITADGKLAANSVETRLKEARNFIETQSHRAKKRWQTTIEPMRGRNANTSTKKEESSLGESQSLDPPVDNFRATAIKAKPKGPPNKRGWNGSRDYQSPTADDLRRAYPKKDNADDRGDQGG